jgi:hypothetical protein
MLIYLLLMPLELCVDSYQDRYYLRLGMLGRASVEKDPVELLRLHLKVLFLNFYWRPSDLKGFKSKPKKRQDHQKRHKGQQFNVSLIKRLLRSFTVRRFRLEVDTGDPVLNAKLYPLFFHLDRRLGGIRLNFVNRNHLLLQITNRPIYLLKAFINT